MVETIYFAILSPRSLSILKKKKSQEILPDLVQKTKDVYVLLEFS
jgi:hypothetical protein